MAPIKKIRFNIAYCSRIEDLFPVARRERAIRKIATAANAEIIRRFMRTVRFDTWNSYAATIPRDRRRDSVQQQHGQTPMRRLFVIVRETRAADDIRYQNRRPFLSMRSPVRRFLESEKFICKPRVSPERLPSAPKQRGRLFRDRLV
jgi:hypothetical protein